MATETTAMPRSQTDPLDVPADAVPLPVAHAARPTPRARPRDPGRSAARDRRPVPATESLDQAVSLVRAGMAPVLVVTRRPPARAWRSLVDAEVRESLTCSTAADLARRVLLERGAHIDVDAGRAASAWERAWRRIGDGSHVVDPWRGSRQWHDEVMHLVKGGAVTRIEDLAGIVADRAHVTRLWDLYVAYSEELAAAFVHDEADLIVMAADELATRPVDRPWFAAVVVDRSCPVCQASDRLVHALVAPR